MMFVQIPELLDWVYWHSELYQVRDRSRNKMTKAVALYLCTCQELVCHHSKEPVPLEDCKQVVNHIRKPGWIGYIHSIPWGLEGLCADVVWVKSPVGPKRGEVLPFSEVPERYPIKDLIKLRGKLDKSFCERQENDTPKPSKYQKLLTEASN